MKEIEENDMDEETKIKKNISIFFSMQPLIGLFISTFTAFLMLLLGREWSLELLFYTLMPFIGLFLIFLMVYIALRKILDLNLLLFKGKIKYLTFFFTLAFVVIEIMIYVFNPK